MQTAQLDMSIAFTQLPSVNQQPGYLTPYSSHSYSPHMHRGNTDYNQSGLNSSNVTPSSSAAAAVAVASAYPYTTTTQSDSTTSEPATAYAPTSQEVRSTTGYTPTTSAPTEYPINNYPPRPTFAQDPHRAYVDRYPQTTSAPSVTMNQSASPLPPLAHGMHRRPPHPESSDDANITATATHPQYPQYSYPTPDMSQYPQPPGAPPPPSWRPDWPPAAYSPFPYPHPGAPQVAAPPSGAMQSPRASSAVDKSRRKRHSNEATPLSQVYSFIPIPGAQQHKRPRRRYEEIERMYKCGWQGCEKAYGTLNHLNAHVTMQAHGAKRTPEEFKEIRKEWKARKKEEEAQRKAQEESERTRQGEQAEQQPQVPAVSAASYSAIPPRQLPPIGYSQSVSTPVHYGVAPSTGIEQLYTTPTAPIYTSSAYAGYNVPQYNAPSRPAAQTQGEDDAEAEPDTDVQQANYTS